MQTEKFMGPNQIMEVNMAVDKEKMASFSMKMEEEWNHLKLEHINRKITSNQH